MAFSAKSTYLKQRILCCISPQGLVWWPSNFFTCSQMPGNDYGGNNSTSPKCGKWSIFANQVTIDRWRMGPIETIHSGHNGAVMNAQNHRWGLGPIETCNSGHNDAVVNAQNNRWGLGPMENSVSGANHAVFLCTNRQVRSGTQRDY